MIVMQLGRLYVCISLFVVTTFAWLHESEGNAMGPAQRRQDASRTTDNSDKTSLPAPTKQMSSDKTSPSTTDTTAPSTKTTHTTGHSGTSTIAYDPRLPADGISMITPNPFSTTYYKIKDHVTFAWNYTSLSATPTAIDILASCSANDRIYTISANVSVSDVQTVVWDIGAYQETAPALLFTEKYTLIVHDSEKDFAALATQAPKAGYLGVVDQFTFGMYLPKENVEFKEWKCVTCSGAVAMNQWTIVAIVGMACLTMLSFS